MKIILLHLSILINFSICRDFYLGMFKKNDLLMRQDTLYKERVPFRYTYAKYGRVYKCPITYVRVIDRLNIGRGPRVEIVRGGLRKKYIVLRFTSPYNNPISVNIFVGCENKKFTNPPWKIVRPTTTTKKNGVDVTDDKKDANVTTDENAYKETHETTIDSAKGVETTVNAVNASSIPDSSPGGAETTIAEPATTITN